MAQQINSVTRPPPERTVVESRVVSPPDARVVETVTVLSKSAAERLETKGEIPEAVVRQFPALDTTEPGAFANAVVARVGGRGRAADDLAAQANAVARYAKTGEGISAADARTTADLVAEAIGYAPLAQAREDGFGIVLLGASARAKLKQGASITTKELHCLATLSHPRRAYIAGDPRGEVPRDEALRYLARRGIEL